MILELAKEKKGNLVVKKFKDWGIQNKLFTVLAGVFLVVLILGALWHYQASKQETLDRVLSEARTVNAILMATRRVYQHQFVDSGIELNEKTLGFLPAHSLNRISDNFKSWIDSGLSFNNVSDRPRNPDNRADVIEMEAIQFFRKHREEKERWVAFNNAQGEAYYHYSQPIFIEPYCMQCHGKREHAPSTIQKLYPDPDSYGYKLGDLRGIISIKLPFEMVNRAAIQRYLKEFAFFVVFFIVLYFLIQYLLQQLITKRLSRLNHAAQQIAVGKDAVLYGDGSMDEIGQLEKAINDMVNRIQQREQDLAITLNSIGDAVIVTDAEGNVTRLNPVAQQLTGWSLQQAQGLPVKTIFSIINSSTRKPVENPVGKVISSGETVSLANHTTLISKNGKEYLIADSAAPIRNGDEGIQGMVLVFNDVTEQYRLRREAAKNLRNLQAIMNYSPAVICVRDIDGRYTFINKQFEQLFHVQQKDIIGKSPFDVFPKEMADEMQCNHKTVLTMRQALRSEDIIPHGDEPHHYVSIKFPLLDSDDNVYAVCSISTDITELKKQEEQVRRSQKMDVIGQFTGGIAHDFNNVLTIIMGNLELLKRQLADDAKALKRVESIGKAGQRAVDLTKQLLSFSRNEPSVKTVTDINHLIDEMKSLIIRAVTPEVEVVVQYADDLWLTEIDPGNFEDSLLNLCINARDAMTGHGHLVIETRNITLDANYCRQNPDITPGDYVELTVSDNGEGIPQELQERIFEPFYTTKEQGKGTGLGLAMVFGFVRRSRGHIKCYSEVGVGTTFHLYLPRANLSTANGEVKQSEQSGEQVEMLPHGTESILVVDDEINLVELAREFLEALGYNVYTANDGKQALEILAKEPTIDLLFSDVVMPGGLNGYQLAQQATTISKKAGHPGLKVLLTSGYTGKAVFHDEQKLFQASLLGKPYNQSELAIRVRAILDGLGMS